MSRCIILPRLQVENANAATGLTWGFPAITQFLGYAHALSRKLQQSHGITLEGCGVICHHHQVHAYNAGGDYQFVLTRNPLSKEGKTASINEEARMHLTVSLVMKCRGTLANGDTGLALLAEHLQVLCRQQRLAGGTVVSMGKVQVRNLADDERVSALFWPLMPGFALVDRSPWLAQHCSAKQALEPQTDMLDAWLDFAALKLAPHTGEGILPEPGAPAEWRYEPKPYAGYLVPLMTGYQRISPCYAPGDVARTRDPATPFCFAEAVYGVGEWCGLHRIHSLDELLWRYHTTETGYYCCGAQAAIEAEDCTYDDDHF
ncbi:type I-F CRISPR-associated protein Csy2 [Chimaeribacter arupi]|uniref:type I-F CRISPR-associated protein Csy2 n=1 Tax=Chimaeribacter arupi TaxID=2060066 RepID=UPI000C7D61FB|nr:type I-F CRISPR-associated protein Csy2 [Chimaeribacter arupi]PLR53007.1 type I-F CRISPR-associated protein Csy2 [Chimaeribacter arupi]